LQAIVVRLAPAAVIMRADEDIGHIELAFFDVRDLESRLGRSGSRLSGGGLSSGWSLGRRLSRSGGCAATGRQQSGRDREQSHGGKNSLAGVHRLSSQVGESESVKNAERDDVIYLMGINLLSHTGDKFRLTAGCLSGNPSSFYHIFQFD
jgi:hypothetical protein